MATNINILKIKQQVLDGMIAPPKIEISDINNLDYAVLQDIVDGCIERVFISNELENAGIDLYVNDEYNIRSDFKPTLAITDNLDILDVIRGNMVFVGHDQKGGSISLTEDQINYILSMLEVVLISDRDSNKEYVIRINVNSNN